MKTLKANKRRKERKANLAEKQRDELGLIKGMQTGTREDLMNEVRVWDTKQESVERKSVNKGIMKDYREKQQERRQKETYMDTTQK